MCYETLLAMVLSVYMLLVHGLSAETILFFQIGFYIKNFDIHKLRLLI
jgi:hypothetical protein